MMPADNSCNIAASPGAVATEVDLSLCKSPLRFSLNIAAGIGNGFNIS
jgi:hypothetical protein